MSTNNTEIEGPLVRIAHAVDGEKTLLALTTRDDLDFDPDEDNESASLSTQKRTRRYRTQNSPAVELGSLLAADLSALAEVGLVDENGNFTTAPDARKLDGAIHIEYYGGEDGTEGEIIHRFEEVETFDLNVDASETPPVSSWTFWVHGNIRLNTPPDLVVG